MIPVRIFRLRRFPIDLGQDFLSVSEIMRLLIEIVIIAGLIYVGWDRPFKEWATKGGAVTRWKIHVPAWEENSSVKKPTPSKTNPH
jgi:hypothetical protein